MFVCPECGQAYPRGGYCEADGTVLEATNGDPLLGCTVGSYRVARLIGEGGMGQVYKGVQPTIGSRVAIKVLTAECARHGGIVERFFAEARAVNLIRHEHIVNVLDLAYLPDRRPYIVMEYLDGAPLSAILRARGPLPAGGFANLVVEVLEALGAAHDKGIVHRDLKPDNVFVTPGGHAKVLDFGIAKLKPGVHEVQGATRTGALLGTPHYMSPEQALGRAVDHRTDLYAVGVILYEGLTGRLPFHSDVLFDLLRQHIEAAPVPPRALRPDLPPALETTLLRALEKDPTLRFQSARELAAALGQLTPFLPPDSFTSLGERGLSARGLAGAATPVGVPTPGAGSTGTPGGASSSAYGGAPPVPPTTGAGTLRSALTATPASSDPGRGRRRGGVAWVAAGLLGVLMLGGLVAVTLVGTGVIALSLMGPRGEDAPPPPRATAEDEAPPPRVPDAPPGGAEELDGTVDFHHRVPAGFAPESVDPALHLPVAERLARQRFPDAGLVSIKLQGLAPQGTVDAVADSRGGVEILFRSPSRSEPPPGRPATTLYKAECYYRYTVTRDGISGFTDDTLDCHRAIVVMPHCTPAQVSEKATRNGAPARRGDFTYSGFDTQRPRWSVTIGDYTNWIADDC